MAGNAVILKHSAQTPLCAERFAECFAAAGLPPGCSRCCTWSTPTPKRVIRDARIDFVAFTGSVAGGRAGAARGRGTLHRRGSGAGRHAIRRTCGTMPTWRTRSRTSSTAPISIPASPAAALQRIYVHESVYERFTRRLHRPDPAVPAGRSAGSGDHARARWCAPRPPTPSVRSCARPLPRARARSIEEREFPRSRAGTPYLAPQVLLDAPVASCGHARGDLRPGGRRHEGAIGRRKPCGG